MLPILSLLLFGVPALAVSDAPIREVDATLALPDGLDSTSALAVVDQELDAVFHRYEPVIPKVPGMRMSLEKEVVSTEGPLVVQLPVDGSAFGRAVVETARVTATSSPTGCGVDQGMRIVLDFEGSSYNIERRIDRIEITACPIHRGGTTAIHAVGRMYAGYKVQDPALNGLQEAIGARALQVAFIRQVPAVLDAVRAQWVEGAPEVQP